MPRRLCRRNRNFSRGGNHAAAGEIDMNLDPYEAGYLDMILEEFGRSYRELASLFKKLQLDPGNFPNEAMRLTA